MNDITIKQLGPADIKTARLLFTLMQEVFETGWLIAVTDQYINKLLSNPAFICFAAMYQGQLAGGLTAYELPMYYAAKSELFIYDIAVQPQFQRKGIGKALFGAVNEYARQQSIPTLFVDADEDDTNALDFYRSLDSKGAKVIQFTIPVK